MSEILFDDPVCPKEYNYGTLENGALGGTEASCLRITNGLHARGHSVWLAQRGRTEPETSNIHYIPRDMPIVGREPNTVITLRDAGVYVSNMGLYPNSRHYLWMHDVVGGEYLDHLVHHLKPLKQVDMICVSQWHKSQILQSLLPHLPDTHLNVRVIYGPLADYCVKKPNTIIDYRKLIFFSSPHKGLNETLEIFKKLRAVDPNYTLYISNPGYFKSKDDLPEGVVGLGTLTHREVIEHVRTSLCLFYPNPVFAETFGLVLAEADAVGTPVIAHPIGAAPEVVMHPKEIMNCLDHDAVIKRVIEYKSGQRLIVKGKKEYTLNRVITEWEKLV